MVAQEDGDIRVGCQKGGHQVRPDKPRRAGHEDRLGVPVPAPVAHAALRCGNLFQVPEHDIGVFAAEAN